MNRPRFRLRRNPGKIQRLQRLVPSGTQLKSVGSTIANTAKPVTDRLPDLPGRKSRSRFGRTTKIIAGLGVVTMVVGFIASRRNPGPLWADDPRIKAAVEQTTVTPSPVQDKPRATGAFLTEDPTLAGVRDNDDALRAAPNPPATDVPTQGDETGDGSEGDSLKS